VRTLIALTLVVWFACSDAIQACCGAYDYCSKDEEVTAAFRAVSPVPPEEGPFLRDWMLVGVEEFIEIGAARNDKSPSKNDSDSEVCEVFSGMWSSPPYGGKGTLISGCHYAYYVPPSTIPPFDPAWLTDTVWPHTRAHLTGEFERLLKESRCRAL
jgi:hypothetical protein